MRSASLRESVTIQVSALQTADAYGGQAEAWADVETVRARIQGSGASERLAARLAIAEAAYLVTMRYTRNMDTKKRLKWYDGTSIRYLYPTSVDADERNRQMICACRETLA
jgi:SPP1 family predicted phage head-tail adaptor